MIELNKNGIKIGLDITKNEAYSLAEFIDENFIDVIQNDDIDNMQWLRNMIHAYEKLCAYSGYVGLTEDTLETCDGDTCPI